MSSVHIRNTVINLPLSLRQSLPLAQLDLMPQHGTCHDDDGHATTYTLYSDHLATVFALVYTKSTAISYAAAWDMVISMPPQNIECTVHSMFCGGILITNVRL